MYFEICLERMNSGRTDSIRNNSSKFRGKFSPDVKSDQPALKN